MKLLAFLEPKMLCRTRRWIWCSLSHRRGRRNITRRVKQSRKKERERERVWETRGKGGIGGVSSRCVSTSSYSYSRSYSRSYSCSPSYTYSPSTVYQRFKKKKKNPTKKGLCTNHLRKQTHMFRPDSMALFHTLGRDAHHLNRNMKFNINQRHIKSRRPMLVALPACDNVAFSASNR